MVSRSLYVQSSTKCDRNQKNNRLGGSRKSYIHGFDVSWQLVSRTSPVFSFWFSTCSYSDSINFLTADILNLN